MKQPSFEELETLASQDPAAFEALRAELIEDCIRSASPASEHRLRGLQFVIDSRRRLARTPMKALIEIQAMMHDSLQRLNLALQSGSTSERASGRVVQPKWNWSLIQSRGNRSRTPSVSHREGENA